MKQKNILNKISTSRWNDSKILTIKDNDLQLINKI